MNNGSWESQMDGWLISGDADQLFLEREKLQEENSLDIFTTLDPIYTSSTLVESPTLAYENEICREGHREELGANPAYLSPTTNATSSTTSNYSSKPVSHNETIVQFPLMRTLSDIPSLLVEYYFKEVAGLFSCYDSMMNPFRTTVSQLWQSSPVICRTLQSMAATCLVEESPHLGKIGIQLRQEAMALLENEFKFDDMTLLALLMLGQTASWHDATDLGIPLFNRVRQLLELPL
jgi:hypothetical protein